MGTQEGGCSFSAPQTACLTVTCFPGSDRVPAPSLLRGSSPAGGQVPRVRAGDIPFLEGGHCGFGSRLPTRSSPVTSASGNWTASFGLIQGAFLAQAGRDFFGGRSPSGRVSGGAADYVFQTASASLSIAA